MADRVWPATSIEYGDEYLDHHEGHEIPPVLPEDIHVAGGLIYRRADIADPKIGHALSLLDATIVSIRPRLEPEEA